MYIDRRNFMLENSNEYFEVLSDIKKTLIVTRNKIVVSANNDLVLMYYIN